MWPSAPTAFTHTSSEGTRLRDGAPCSATPARNGPVAPKGTGTTRGRARGRTRVPDQRPGDACRSVRVAPQPAPLSTDALKWPEPTQGSRESLCDAPAGQVASPKSTAAGRARVVRKSGRQQGVRSRVERPETAGGYPAGRLEICVAPTRTAGAPSSGSACPPCRRPLRQAHRPWRGPPGRKDRHCRRPRRWEGHLGLS